jgi:hypothetical protein
LSVVSVCHAASLVEYVSALLRMLEYTNYQLGTRAPVATCYKELCWRVVTPLRRLDPNDASSAVGCGAARAMQGHGTAPATVLPALVYPVVAATVVGTVR